VSKYTDISLELGAAVVKTVLNSWTGPLAPLLDVTVDHVKAHAKNRVEERKVSRFFNQCEEVVARHAALILDRSEYSSLDDNEREAAVYAVRDTLQEANYRRFRSDLAQREVIARGVAQNIGEKAIEYDLDSASLERFLRPTSELVLERAALSYPAAELYRLLIKEVCNYVVQLVPTLPRFDNDALVALLRRDSLILKQVDDLLSRTPRRRSPRDFRADYARLVVAKHDKTKIFGLTGVASSHYPLSVAYMSLRAEERGRAANAEAPTPSSRLSIEQVSARKRRMLIRGDAGSGKTTLLHWMAVRCARQEFSEGLDHLNGYIPFVITLRRYTEEEFPPPERWVAAVAPEIAAEMPTSWVHELLREGKALVLVDGLDEVSGGSHRTKAYEWLEGLLEHYPHSTFFITARPPAVDETWLAAHDINLADLLDMSLSDVREFVARWHKAAAEAPSIEEPHRLRTDERELLSAVETDRHLRLLAVNPLLCAMLCTLNRQRKGKLPRERMEIYEAALKMLLEDRDRDREISVAVTTTSKQLIFVLQSLAFWLVRQGWSFAERARVEAQLEKSIAILHDVDHSAKEVLDHLIERTGVLREPVPGQIDFIHLSFQEYLAGQAAADNDESGLVLANAEQDQWRSVVLMTIAHARPAMCVELMRGLLKKARVAKGPSHIVYLLTHATSYARFVPPDLRSEIQKIAPPLVPPKSLDEAQTLAPLGQLIIDLLERELPLPIETVEASIRTLSLIGGGRSLSLIARIIGELQTVNDEILKAWPYFDEEEYARAVFPRIRRDAFVGISDVRLMRYLDKLPPLRQLWLPAPLQTLNSAATPPPVDQLRLFRRPRQQLAGLEKWSNVRELIVDFTNTVARLDPIAEIAGLESLTIVVHQPIAARVDVKPLHKMKSLKQLSVATDGNVEIVNSDGTHFAIKQERFS
jgi:hypothetical protein